MDLSHLKKHREKLARHAKDYKENPCSDYNSHGGIVYEDGKLHIVGRWACHGWLSEYNFGDFNRLKGNKPKYILSTIMAPRTTKEKLINFTDWLINRSVWKDVFLEKDAEQAELLGHVVDANFPANFVASAMMASRFLTEVYVSGMDKREIVYDELLKLGLSEDESFFFAHLYKPNGGGTYPIVFNRLSSGHSTFLSSGFNKEYCKNFLTHTPQKNKFNRPLSTGTGYVNDTVNILWGEPNRDDPLGRFAKNLRPKTHVLGTDHHIFRKIPDEPWVYTNPEDFLNVLQQLKEDIYA